MSSVVNIDTLCEECGRTADDNQCSHDQCRHCEFVGCRGCVIDHELIEHSSGVTDDIDYEEPIDLSSYNDILAEIREYEKE